MGSVIEDHAVGEGDRRRLDGYGSLLAFGEDLFGAGQGTDDRGAGFGIDAVSARVVAVPMRIEEKPDGFGSNLADQRQDFPGRLSEVGVDDQNVVFEDD